MTIWSHELLIGSISAVLIAQQDLRECCCVGSGRSCLPANVSWPGIMMSGLLNQITHCWQMSQLPNDNIEEPSKWWYLGHLFFWVISGLVCYALYKESNKPAAKRHLIRSLWFPVAVWFPATILLGLAGV